MHPFSFEAESRLIHMPQTLKGSVIKKVLSLWAPTSPPIFGFLKMYIDYAMHGFLNNIISLHKVFTTWEYEKLSKVGWRSCIACPTLLKATDLSTINFPFLSKAFSSKNGFIYHALFRKKLALFYIFVSNSSGTSWFKSYFSIRFAISFFNTFIVSWS